MRHIAEKGGVQVMRHFADKGGSDKAKARRKDKAQVHDMGKDCGHCEQDDVITARREEEALLKYKRQQQENWDQHCRCIKALLAEQQTKDIADLNRRLDERMRVNNFRGEPPSGWAFGVGHIGDMRLPRPPLKPLTDAQGVSQFGSLWTRLSRPSRLQASRTSRPSQHQASRTAKPSQLQIVGSSQSQTSQINKTFEVRGGARGTQPMRHYADVGGMPRGRRFKDKSARREAGQEAVVTQPEKGKSVVKTQRLQGAAAPVRSGLPMRFYRPVDRLIITAIYPCPDTGAILTGAYLFKYPAMLHEAEDTVIYQAREGGPLMEISSLSDGPNRAAIMEQCLTIIGASPLDQGGHIVEDIMNLDCSDHGLVMVQRTNFQVWSWIRTDLPSNMATNLAYKTKSMVRTPWTIDEHGDQLRSQFQQRIMQAAQFEQDGPRYNDGIQNVGNSCFAATLFQLWASSNNLMRAFGEERAAISAFPTWVAVADLLTGFRSLDVGAERVAQDQRTQEHH